MKKERTVYWKVLTPDRLSAVASHYPGLGIRYPVGEKVRKPQDGGPLMVFSRKICADSFVYNNRGRGEFIIVKCHATKDRIQKRRLLWLGDIANSYYNSDTLSETKKFWQMGFDHKIGYIHHNLKYDIPDGTVFVTSVTCLE